jgi:hypothetical protein
MLRSGICRTVAILVLAVPEGSSCSEPPEAILNGPSIQVKVGSVLLCVARNFIYPHELTQALSDRKPITGYPYDRVQLAMFTPLLTGFTTKHYEAGLDKVYDKKKYPADWVRVTIWPGDQRDSFRPNVAAALGPYYERDSTVDLGFTSHRAERNCVGKVAGSGWVQIQSGPECLENELKYGHPADPNIVLSCNTSRCWVNTRLHTQDVWYDYDFPRTFLSQWSILNARIKGRVGDWKNDRSCFK